LKFLENQNIALLVLIVFSACLFCAGIGVMPLTDPDEVFYAETAREMLKKGDFLTPYIFGKPQFEKPPLYYWLVILAFKAFGINEFAARIPSAIFGIIGIIGVYFLGKILFNEKTAFFSGIIMATSVSYIALSRACVTDVVLSVFFIYTFLFFFIGFFSSSKPTIWYLLSALAMAFAVVTKGPIGVFLPVGIILIYLLFTKKIKRLKEIPILKGSLIFLLVALPWYLIMYRLHGSNFTGEFFGFHNIVRYLKPEHPSTDFFLYYFVVIAAGFFPYSALLPVSIWQAFREKDKYKKEANTFLAVWALAIIVFFTFSRTKLPTYIFPMFPVLALFSGRLWDLFFGGNLPKPIFKWTRISACTTFLVILIGLAVFYVASKIYFPDIAIPVLATAVLFTAFLASTVVMTFRKRQNLSILLFIVAFLIIAVPSAYIIAPEIGKGESSKDISFKTLEYVKSKNEDIGAETHYRRGVAFYTKRQYIPDVHKYSSLRNFLIRKDRVWCIIKDKNHRHLYMGESPFEKPTYVVYQLGKKILVTNKIPPGGKFLKKRSKNDY